MTPIQQILAKQAELEAMIDALREPEDTQPRYFEFMGTRYHFDRGETYVCTMGHPGQKATHTILLPFGRKGAPWGEQMAWAKGKGFDLPTRFELLMMWSTMRDRFQTPWYWSNELHHQDSAFAWCQIFTSGGQRTIPKSAALRAVAVRRIQIGD